MTCAFRISDSRCCLSCGSACGRWRKEIGTRREVHTTGIDDVGCYVLWGDFGGDGDLRDNVLDL